MFTHFHYAANKVLFYRLPIVTLYVANELTIGRDKGDF